MQNAILKLTAIAGVIGLGCLALLQAQRGMNGPHPSAEVQSAAIDSAGGSQLPAATTERAEPSAPSSGQNNATFFPNDVPNLAASDETSPARSSEAAQSNADERPWYEQQDEPPQPSDDAVLPDQFVAIDEPMPQLADSGANRESTSDSLDFRDARQESPSVDGQPEATRSTSQSTATLRPPDTQSEAGPELGDARDSAAPTAPITHDKIAESSAEAEPGQFAPSGKRLIPIAQAEAASTNTMTPVLPDPTTPEIQKVEATDSPDSDVTITTGAIPSDKQQAIELLGEAREAMQSGDMETARQLAHEAEKLPATYDIFDDNPSAVLSDIDRIAREQSVDASHDAKGTEANPPQVSKADTFPGLDDETPPNDDIPAVDNSAEIQVAPDAFGGMDDPSSIESSSTPSSTTESQTQVPVVEEFAPTEAESSQNAMSTVDKNVPDEILQSTPEMAQPNSMVAIDNSPSPHALSPPETAKPATESAGKVAREVEGDGVVSDAAPQGAQRPQLTIEKAAPPNAVLGQPMVYSIIVRNVGESVARNVVVEDQIPRGSTLSGTIPQAELIGKRLVWRLGTLTPGEEKKIAVRVVPTAAGSIGSVATVNFVSEVAAKTIVTAPKLELEMSAASVVAMGTSTALQFQIANAGTGDATNVVLRSLLADELDHADGRDLEYPIGTLSAGQKLDVQLTVNAAQPGQAICQAILTADGGIEIKRKATIDVVGSRLLITRTGPSRKYIGRNAVFTNKITNQSNEIVDGAIITETVPEGMEFLEASGGGQYHASKRTVAWRIDRLAPGGSHELTVSLRPIREGVHKSLVAAVDLDGNRAEVESQTEAVGLALLTVDLSETQGTMAQGEQATVSLHVRNRGTAATSNVRVEITIPTQMRLDTFHGPTKHTVLGDHVACEPIESIPAGGEVEIKLDLTALVASDVRLKVQVKSDEMTQPLMYEQPFVIFEEDAVGANQ